MSVKPDETPKPWRMDDVIIQETPEDLSVRPKPWRMNDVITPKKPKHMGKRPMPRRMDEVIIHKNPEYMDEKPKPWRMDDVIIEETPEDLSVRPKPWQMNDVIKPEHIDETPKPWQIDVIIHETPKLWQIDDVKTPRKPEHLDEKTKPRGVDDVIMSEKPQCTDKIRKPQRMDNVIRSEKPKYVYKGRKLRRMDDVIMSGKPQYMDKRYKPWRMDNVIMSEIPDDSEDMDESPKPWRMEDVIIFEKPQFISLGINDRELSTQSSQFSSCCSEAETEINVSEHQIGTINDPLHIPEHSFCYTNNSLNTEENVSVHNDVKKTEHENYNDTDDPFAFKKNHGGLCAKTEPEDHIAINNISSANNDISVKLKSCDVKDEFQICMKNLNSDIQCSNMIETDNRSNVTSLDCIRKNRSYRRKSDSSGHSVKKRKTERKCKNQVVTPNSFPSDRSTQNNTILDENNIFILPDLDTPNSLPSDRSIQNTKIFRKANIFSLPNLDTPHYLPSNRLTQNNTMLGETNIFNLPDLDTSQLSNYSMQNEQSVVLNEKHVMQNKESVTRNEECDVGSSCGNFKRKRKLRKVLPDLNKRDSSSLSNQKIKKERKPRKKFQSCNPNTVESSDNLKKKNEGNIEQDEKLKTQEKLRRSSKTCKNQSKSLTKKVDLTHLFSEDDLKNFEFGNEKLGLCATLEDIMYIPGISSDHVDSANVELCTVLKWYRIPSDKLAFHQDQNPHVCVDKCNTKRKCVRNCPMCPEQFRTICNVPYDTHILIHTNYKMYQCPKCPKTFPLMSNVHKHLDFHFKLTYKCKRCNETFAHKCKLLHHHTIHSDNIPFLCKGCGDLFSTNLELTYHRINSCEQPFKCVICNSTFKWYSQLRLHKRKHETKRSYGCLFCANRFMWSAHAYYHLEETHNIDMTYLWNLRDYNRYRRPGKYTYL